MTDIEEMGFSARTYNILKKAGLATVDSILAIKDIIELYKLRNCGKKALFEIINVMRENGYIEWVDKMETELKKLF